MRTDANGCERVGRRGRSDKELLGMIFVMLLRSPVLIFETHHAVAALLLGGGEVGIGRRHPKAPR